MVEQIKFLSKQEIVNKVKAKRTTIQGMTDNSYISTQAIGIIKRLPDFEVEDFMDWWHKHTTLGNVGGAHILAYLESKENET